MESTSIVQNILFNGLISGQPVSFFCLFSLSPWSKKMNSIILRKVNKGRRISWLGTVTNGIIILTNGGIMGMINWALK